jgi:hypothetical protein
MKRSLLLASAALMVIAVASMPKIAAAEDFEQINNLIANAKSPEDHQKIANYFDEQAAAAEKEAEWHKKLLGVYKNNPRLSGEQMHCSRLVGVYKNEAKEDRALAQEYRNMDKK